MKKPIKADPFSLWGRPPKAILHGMSAKQIAQIKAYISRVTDDAYKRGYDLGHDLGRDRGRSLGYDLGFMDAMYNVALMASTQIKSYQDRSTKRTRAKAGQPASA